MVSPVASSSRLSQARLERSRTHDETTARPPPSLRPRNEVASEPSSLDTDSMRNAPNKPRKGKEALQGSRNSSAAYDDSANKHLFPPLPSETHFGTTSRRSDSPDGDLHKFRTVTSSRRTTKRRWRYSLPEFDSRIEEEDERDFLGHLDTRYASRPARVSPSHSSTPNYPLEGPSRHSSASWEVSRSDSSDILNPFLSIFFYLAVAAVAVCSFATVLVAGFTLTVYDDCGRRVERVRRQIDEGQRVVRGSIQGMRHGMASVLGGARGAIELVGRHTGVGTIMESAGSLNDRPTVRSSSRGRRRSTSRSASVGRSRTRAWKAPTTSHDRSRAAHPSSTRSNPVSAKSPLDLPEKDDVWSSDSDSEDAEPYFVPNSTPYTSAPGSPRLRPALHNLPPRPPLIYLVPSLAIAILFLLVKVGWTWWTVSHASRPRDGRRTAFT